MTTARSLILILFTNQPLIFTTLYRSATNANTRISSTGHSSTGHVLRACNDATARTPNEAMTTRRELVGNIATASVLGLALRRVNPAVASTKDPKTGVVLPSEGNIKDALPTSWDEDDNPFLSMGQDKLSWLDKAPDSIFYADPRFVEHVDENAFKTMTSYISDRFLKPNDSVLDLCSRWTSHIDPVAREGG